MARSDKTPRTVAVIDDDSGFATVLCKRLELAGWSHVVSPAAPLIEDLAALRPAAVVVNPDVLGAVSWEYLQRFAESRPSVGLIVCARQSSVAQRVRGLRLGVDDWIGKPCHPEEVVARIEAVTRRNHRAEVSDVESAGPMVAGELEFRLDRYEVRTAAGAVDLTKREYELLLLLARSDGRVLPRDQIYQRVWGYAMARGDRSVDVFVRKLRHKLESASPDWRYIHTHFGIGYRFDAEPVDPGAGDAPIDADADADAVPAADVVPDATGPVVPVTVR